MKSIKEKAEELYPTRKVSAISDLANEKFVEGANYVLKKFVDIVNKNTKPNGMEDRAKMASDMLILITQLKK